MPTCTCASSPGSSLRFSTCKKRSDAACREVLRAVFHHNHELTRAVIAHKGNAAEDALQGLAHNLQRPVAIVAIQLGKLQRQRNEGETILKLALAVMLDTVVAAFAVGQTGLLIHVQEIVNEVAQAA